MILETREQIITARFFNLTINSVANILIPCSGHQWSKEECILSVDTQIIAEDL